MIDTEKFRGRVSVTGAKKDDSRKNGVLITTTIGKVFAIYTKTTIESEIWIKMIQQAVQNLSGEKQSVRFQIICAYPSPNLALEYRCRQEV
jgi:hypothetical protein